MESEFCFVREGNLVFFFQKGKGRTLTQCPKRPCPNGGASFAGWSVTKRSRVKPPTREQGLRLAWARWLYGNVLNHGIEFTHRSGVPTDCACNNQFSWNPRIALGHMQHLSHSSFAWTGLFRSSGANDARLLTLLASRTWRALWFCWFALGLDPAQRRLSIPVRGPPRGSAVQGKHQATRPSSSHDGGVARR